MPAMRQHVESGCQALISQSLSEQVGTTILQFHAEDGTSVHTPVHVYAYTKSTTNPGGFAGSFCGLSQVL